MEQPPDRTPPLPTMQRMPSSHGRIAAVTPSNSSFADNEFQENNLRIVVPSQPLDDKRKANDNDDSSSHGSTEDENDDKNNEEVATCSICFEPWTNSGSHRLVSLKCGHLFGLKCIKRWIKSRKPDSKCPQCNSSAKERDIRILFAKKLVAVDTAEREKLKTQLQEERTLRSKSQSALSNLELQLTSTFRQLQRTQEEAVHWKALYEQAVSSGDGCSNGDNQDGRRGLFHTKSFATICKNDETCRKMAICPVTSMIVASYSSGGGFSQHHGFVKMSTMDLNWQERIPNIHEGQIRDISRHPEGIGMILSTGWDNKMKITDVQRTNSILHSFNMEAKGWSCCWSHDFNVAYCGLANSNIIGYDIRMINSALLKIPSSAFGSPKMKPIHTLEYVNLDSDNHGLLLAHYDGVFFLPYDSAKDNFSASPCLTVYQVPQIGAYQCTFARFVPAVDENDIPMVLVSVRCRLQLEHILVPWPSKSKSTAMDVDTLEQQLQIPCGTAKVISHPTVFSSKGKYLCSFNETKKIISIFDIQRNQEGQSYKTPVQELPLASHNAIMEIVPWEKTENLESGFFALSERCLSFYAATN